MARKKKHPEHVNHERWLISYADFITLLFAFFVVMFAVSQVDSQKVGRFQDSFSLAVGVNSGEHGYLPRKEDDVIGRLEFAMEAVIKADPVEAKLRAAQKEGKLPQRTAVERRDAAVKQGLITLAEFEHLARTDRLRREVIMVDDFPNDLSRKKNEETKQWPRAVSM